MGLFVQIFRPLFLGANLVNYEIDALLFLLLLVHLNYLRPFSAWTILGAISGKVKLKDIKGDFFDKVSEIPIEWNRSSKPSTEREDCWKIPRQAKWISYVT